MGKFRSGLVRTAPATTARFEANFDAFAKVEAVSSQARQAARASKARLNDSSAEAINQMRDDELQTAVEMHGLQLHKELRDFATQVTMQSVIETLGTVDFYVAEGARYIKADGTEVDRDKMEYLRDAKDWYLRRGRELLE
jgi:hypothetical protein